MPDWFYRTVSRPLLFRLPANRARDFALGFLGRLARLPFGAGPEQASEGAARVIGALAERACVFALMAFSVALEANGADEQGQAHVGAVRGAANRATPPRPVLVGVPADLDGPTVERFLGRA